MQVNDLRSYIDIDRISDVKLDNYPVLRSYFANLNKIDPKIHLLV